MWIADKWKEYEVIDCTTRRKTGKMGKIYSVQTRSAGDLGYP